jgi:hypothetical protein
VTSTGEPHQHTGRGSVRRIERAFGVDRWCVTSRTRALESQNARSPLIAVGGERLEQSIAAHARHRHPVDRGPIDVLVGKTHPTLRSEAVQIGVVANGRRVQRDDPRDRDVTIENHELFAPPHPLEVRAQLISELTDADPTRHLANIAKSGPPGKPTAVRTGSVAAVRGLLRTTEWGR